MRYPQEPRQLISMSTLGSLSLLCRLSNVMTPTNDRHKIVTRVRGAQDAVSISSSVLYSKPLAPKSPVPATLDPTWIFNSTNVRPYHEVRGTLRQGVLKDGVHYAGLLFLSIVELPNAQHVYNMARMSPSNGSFRLTQSPLLACVRKLVYSGYRFSFFVFRML